LIISDACVVLHTVPRNELHMMFSGKHAFHLLYVLILYKNEPNL
jgi:hypothetical protein